MLRNERGERITKPDAGHARYRECCHRRVEPLTRQDLSRGSDGERNCRHPDTLQRPTDQQQAEARGHGGEQGSTKHDCHAAQDRRALPPPPDEVTHQGSTDRSSQHRHGERPLGVVDRHLEAVGYGRHERSAEAAGNRVNERHQDEPGESEPRASIRSHPDSPSHVTM